MLIAYSVLYWISKFKTIPRKLFAPILIGAILPDFDLLFSWIPYFIPKLFWLQHRAISHSFLGVIPFILLTGFLLDRPFFKKKLVSPEDLQTFSFFSISGLGFLYIGALFHFLADFVVPTGMMLFFPFTFKWYGIRILSTNNIHSIAAIAFFSTVWPIRRSRKKQQQLLSFFMITLTIFSIVRIVVHYRSQNLYQEQYGVGQFSSSEYVFSHNVNYGIYNQTDPNNRIFIFTLIDGLKGEFISEVLIPEYSIIATNQSMVTQGMQYINQTKNNPHYYRLSQKYSIVCAYAWLKPDKGWNVKWTAPVREFEKRVDIAFIDYSTPLEIIFRFSNSGDLLSVKRPVSI
jgi:membrane-bound metal-dependent hydrolase YbcI (DUF457 family)